MTSHNWQLLKLGMSSSMMDLVTVQGLQIKNYATLADILNVHCYGVIMLRRDTQGSRTKRRGMPGVASHRCLNMGYVKFHG